MGSNTAAVMRREPTWEATPTPDRKYLAIGINVIAYRPRMSPSFACNSEDR